MDSGYYAAMTGLVARTQALDTAAPIWPTRRLPATGPSGSTSARCCWAGCADSQLGQTVNNYGLLGGDRLSMAQGALQQTGNPLDLAIEGEGFFQVQTANGLRYTRDGSFHRARTGNW
jgi:flagellar basal-body rod protein FlgF